MLTRRSRSSVVPQEQGDEALRRIGQELRDARTARGEDLNDIAAFLRIRPSHLVALETGDLTAIPGRPYAIGFLRTYADYLGLDSDALVERLKATSRGVAAPPELVYREPLSESRRPTAAIVTASLLVAAALYAGYYVATGGPAGPPEQVAKVPGELGQLADDVLSRRDPGVGVLSTRSAANADVPAPAAVPSGGAAASAQSASPPASSPGLPPALSVPNEPTLAQALARPASSAPDVTSAVAAESTERSGAPAGGTTPAAGLPQQLAALDSEAIRAATSPITAPAPTGSRIVIVARESSWIQVRSTGRDYIRTRTLSPGEQFPIPDRADLALWTGNAGGLDILVDGRSLGRLGDSGVIIKNLPLAPDSLRQRTVATR